MSLVPALIAMLVVLMVTTGSAFLSQDSLLAAGRRADRQLALERAEAMLQHEAAVLAGQTDGDGGDPAVEHADIRSSPFTELNELPLVLHRLTAVGRGRQVMVRLQADYAIEGCVSAYDDGCQPRLRRIAWRELPVE